MPTPQEIRVAKRAIQQNPQEHNGLWAAMSTSFHEIEEYMSAYDIHHRMLIFERPHMQAPWRYAGEQ